MTATTTLSWPGASKTLPGLAPYPTPVSSESSASASPAPSGPHAPSIKDFRKQGPSFKVHAQPRSTRPGKNVDFDSMYLYPTVRVAQPAAGSGEHASVYFGKMPYRSAPAAETRAAADSEAMSERSAAACCSPSVKLHLQLGMRGHGSSAAATSQ